MLPTPLILLECGSGLFTGSQKLKQRPPRFFIQIIQRQPSLRRRHPYGPLPPLHIRTAKPHISLMHPLAQLFTGEQQPFVEIRGVGKVKPCKQIPPIVL